MYVLDLWILPCHSLHNTTTHVLLSVHFSLEDDCAISPDAMATFLERVSSTFGLHHNDREIATLKVELNELLCHNTNLTEFVRLIRKSNQSGSSEESPRTTIKSLF